MRADVQAVLDGWLRLNRKEGRRLARTSVIGRLDGLLGTESVIWFQRVQWWPATASVQNRAPVDPDDDIFGGSILGFSTADEDPSGQPDDGVVALTATRLLLIGERTRSSWPLTEVARFSFHPARFVQSTAAHFELRTPAGMYRLLPGRGASPERMLTEVAEALARRPAAAAASPAVAADRSESSAALLGQLSEMRDRGTITQEQFEAERSRLLN